METEDFALPSLSPQLTITRAADTDGEPAWMVHHPVSNAYFKLDWPSFECLSRLGSFKTASALKEAIERETTLSLSLDQIRNIVLFLKQNALAYDAGPVPVQAARKAPWWLSLFHGYLYFTLPLFRPQSFLNRCYPKISFLFSPFFVRPMLVFLVVMVLFTLPRLDEFLHTFSNLFSIEGALSVLAVFAFIKIIHEWAHAFAATRYGVAVPHMGVALIVLYPVLYTETTAGWLASRKARLHIGLAGIVAELCLAGVFLFLWHVFPSGSLGQSLCFLVVSVSLAGSLLVNLNPLMRFDGYYILSDLTSIENLQGRACAFARWRFREILFGLGEAAPEEVPPARQKFLTAFGAALIVYRFLLFTGIALLVYHLFVQPLGLFLMLLELFWFIGLPVWGELKTWWRKRALILRSARTLVLFCALCLCFLAVILPWKSSVVLPAVWHAAAQETFYAPSPARILSLLAGEGQAVKEGDILAELESPELEYSLKLAAAELEALENLRRRALSSGLAQENLSQESLEKARLKLRTLEAKKARLTLRASFDGVILTMFPDISAGRYIGNAEPLFTLVAPQNASITAYAAETDHGRIIPGGRAEFTFAREWSEPVPANVDTIAPTGGHDIAWPELSSLNGGPIAADRGADGAVSARRSLYEIKADPAALPVQNLLVRTGYLRVETQSQSLLFRWIRNFASLIRREAKLG